MAVLTFSQRAPVETCSACFRPIAEHRVNGREIGCRADVVIGRDQYAFARQLRLARLQSGRRRVRPFGIDVEEMEAR